MLDVFMCKHAVHTEVGLIVYSNEIQECKQNYSVIYVTN